MLKGPRLKTVSYRTLGFPECGMSNASNFTRGFTPASIPERGNNIWAKKWAFIYVKRAKVKNSVISYIWVPRVRNGQCKQRLKNTNDQPIHPDTRSFIYADHFGIASRGNDFNNIEASLTSALSTMITYYDKTNCVRTLQRHRCVLST